jgi:hypothetical protein
MPHVAAISVEPRIVAIVVVALVVALVDVLCRRSCALLSVSGHTSALCHSKLANRALSGRSNGGDRGTEWEL